MIQTSKHTELMEQDGAEGGLANPQVEKKGCLILGMTQVCSEEQGSEISAPLGTELKTACFSKEEWTLTTGFVWGKSLHCRVDTRLFLDVCNLLLLEFTKSKKLLLLCKQMRISQNMTSTLLFTFECWKR